MLRYAALRYVALYATLRNESSPNDAIRFPPVALALPILLVRLLTDWLTRLTHHDTQVDDAEAVHSHIDNRQKSEYLDQQGYDSAQ